MPVLKPLARRGRPAPPDREHLPGGVGRRAGRRRRARQAGPQGGRPGRRAHPRRRRRRVPGAGRSSPSPIAFNVLPLRRHARRRRRRSRPTRSRSSATRAARSSTSPTSPCRARACGCRCSRATRCRSTPSSRGRSRSSGRYELLAQAPGVALTDVPDAARGRRRATPASSAASVRTRPCPTAAAWRCSSATTTSARAPPSTPSRSPSSSSSWYCVPRPRRPDMAALGGVVARTLRRR